MMNWGMAAYKNQATEYVVSKGLGFANPDMTRAPYQNCLPVDQTDTYGFVFSRYRGDSPFSVMTSKQTSRCLASPQAALNLANHLGGHFLTWVNAPTNWSRQEQTAFVNSRANEPNGGLTAPRPSGW